MSEYLAGSSQAFVFAKSSSNRGCVLSLSIWWLPVRFAMKATSHDRSCDSSASNFYGELSH